MGNWNEQQDRKKEGKEKDKVRKEKLSSFFYDSAKLILAGIVIGGISPIFTNSENELNLYLIGAGILATFIFAKIGNDILK